MSENLADAFLNGKSLKNAPGPYFGEYGGRWMPESLIAAMDELETTFNEAKNDPSSWPSSSASPPSTRTVRRC